MSVFGWVIASVVAFVSKLWGAIGLLVADLADLADDNVFEGLEV